MAIEGNTKGMEAARKSKEWTPEEKQILKSCKSICQAKANLPKRTKSSIVNMAHILGVSLEHEPAEGYNWLFMNKEMMRAFI